MKGYITVLVLAAALLLLIPLPALPSPAPVSAPSLSNSNPKGDDNPDNQPAGVTITTTATTASVGATTTAPTTNEATFRLLCGEEVVTLAEREFLIRTLAFEMPAAYHAEALKAQAVAAYTYYGRRRAAQREKADPALKGADFNSPADTFPRDYTPQALKSKWGDHYDTYYNKICAAVDAVLGKTITYKGDLIDACYFAISNGSTEAAKTVWGQEVAYLQAVASPGDCLSPNYQTSVNLTSEQVRTALVAAQEDLQLADDPAKWFGEPICSPTGTVTTIPVGNSRFTGTAVRQALSLRSATFTVSWQDGHFVFTVKGYGHGVGMSQYGADFLARQGYTYKEILEYYYTDVRIS